MHITTINPTTEAILQTYPVLTKEKTEQLIDCAVNAYQKWKTTDFSIRSALMNTLADQLRLRQHDYAALMAEEMGKPIRVGKAEILKSALVCEHFAQQAESYLQPREIPTPVKKTKVHYHPLGVIFAIMPWNFPFWQVFRFAAPTIMAGNAVILKHAPITTGCGAAIADLFLEAGFPEYLFQQFILDNAAAEKVIANNGIAGVTLTGSVTAGRQVGSAAGQHLKKIVLELGGNDPYVVLADADLDLAAECIVTSRLSNTGQVCIAAKRTIVVASIAEALVEKIIARCSTYALGDPMDADANFGPMARADLRDHLHQKVMESQTLGAQLRLGGKIPKRHGFYYPPTVLTGVVPGMPAFDDELFGPVIAITVAHSEQHAIDLANQSVFGLGAAVFTQDIARGERIAVEQLDVGSCFVNAFVASDPLVPFGGIKLSGYGRELSREGIHEFVNIKTVSVHHDS